ncbi:hypothetical protein LI328DRAFT_131132 [Trichoderma asperelloides]|nr:hypothetical protein LI328DRAFT_131132 [Trichoderma asperelloides]
MAPEEQLLCSRQFSPDFANGFLAPLPRHGTAANAPLPNRRGSPATALHDGRSPCLFPLSCSAFSNALSLARLNRTIYFLNPGDAMLARARAPLGDPSPATRESRSRGSERHATSSPLTSSIERGPLRCLSRTQ